jgi:hypothetical protein
LHCAIQVGGGQSQAAIQAERIGGIGFLCRYHTATKPLIIESFTSFGNGADGAVFGDDRSPHVQLEATIFWTAGCGNRSGKRCLKRSMTWQCVAQVALRQHG